MSQTELHNKRINLRISGWKSFLFPVLLVLILLASVLGSQINMIVHEKKAVNSDMQERLYEKAQSIETMVAGIYDAIEAVAPMMAFEVEQTQEQMLVSMNSLLTACNFDFVVRTDTDGIAFNHLGREGLNLSDREYVQTALSGRPAIEHISSGVSDPTNSYVVFAVPVVYDRQVVGVLHGSFKAAGFVDLLTEFSSEHISGCDEMSIIAADGTPVASDNPSVDTAALTALYEQAYDRDAASDKNTCYDVTCSNGDTRHYYAQSLDMGNGNRWLITSRMEQGYLQSQTKYSRLNVMVLGCISVITTVALLYIFISRQRLSNELKRHSVQLTAALNAAESADTAKSRFLSRMSHEIRTPLNAIIGYNTVAMNEISSAKTDVERKIAEMKLLDCMTKSGVASKHLLTIINDVLDMSAIESGKIIIAHERFDFKSLINSLTVLFYTQAKSKNILFEVVFSELGEEWFAGDQMRLSQILTNLLSNAVKFTPENGSVVLFVKQTVTDEKTTAFHFEVTDTGIGMAPEFLSHIWSAFEQAEGTISRRFGGTGLGMTITKNLVELMGGTICVESKLGVGSKFIVDLTLDRVEQPTQGKTFDFSTINALVVDDDISTCDYIRLLFDRCGARCTTAATGQEALELYRAAIEADRAFNLCLVDWQMPGMNGIETVEAIRAQSKTDVPIIVITAYDYADVVEAATIAGADSFVAKPLFQSSLFDMLANISGQKTLVSAAETSKHDFHGARVLLAEDNSMNMEIAKRILESASLVVDSAWNGRQAVEMFEKSPAGTYSAVLMDIHMPEMDGHEAAKAIRASTHPEAKSIPVIAMTADAFSENVREAYDAGMNDHISKPIDLPTLFSTLEKYMPGH